MLPLDVIARPPCRLLLCTGPTCGLNPDLPAERLREAWEREDLGATVGLRLSACQDRCERASVARVFTAAGTEWYQRLTADDYAALLDWARACRAAGAVLPRPASLAAKAFDGSAR